MLKFQPFASKTIIFNILNIRNNGSPKRYQRGQTVDFCRPHTHSYAVFGRKTLRLKFNLQLALPNTKYGTQFEPKNQKEALAGLDFFHRHKKKN